MSSLTSHQRCIRLRAALQREIALRLRCRKPRALRADRVVAQFPRGLGENARGTLFTPLNAPALFA
ncbi:MAG: hypothetical protein RLZZ618_2444 [Pseudomonadota bacterium]